MLSSGIPNDRIMGFDETTGVGSIFRRPSRNAHCNTMDQQGRLVTYEHRGRGVSCTEQDGRVVTIADRFDGKRLNSPNDVVVAADGAVWSTDPTCGIDSDYEVDTAAEEIGAFNVCNLDPSTGQLRTTITVRLRPNGLCFSPDYCRLYVSDIGPTHKPDLPRPIHALMLSADHSAISDQRCFAISDAGFSDGFRCDKYGNL